MYIQNSYTSHMLFVLGFQVTLTIHKMLVAGDIPLQDCTVYSVHILAYKTITDIWKRKMQCCKSELKHLDPAPR